MLQKNLPPCTYSLGIPPEGRFQLQPMQCEARSRSRGGTGRFFETPLLGVVYSKVCVWGGGIDVRTPWDLPLVMGKGFFIQFMEPIFRGNPFTDVTSITSVYTFLYAHYLCMHFSMLITSVCTSLCSLPLYASIVIHL